MWWIAAVMIVGLALVLWAGKYVPDVDEDDFGCDCSSCREERGDDP